MAHIAFLGLPSPLETQLAAVLQQQGHRITNTLNNRHASSAQVVFACCDRSCDLAVIRALRFRLPEVPVIAVSSDSNANFVEALGLGAEEVVCLRSDDRSWQKAFGAPHARDFEVSFDAARIRWVLAAVDRDAFRQDMLVHAKAA